MKHLIVSTGLFSCIILMFSCGNPSRNVSELFPVQTSALRLNILQPPAILTDDNQRITWYAEHYWDNLDWADIRWIADTVALEGVFSSWAQLLSQIPEAETAKLTGGLIRTGNDYPEMQLRLLDMAEYFWQHPNSPFRNEELFIPVLEAITGAPHIDDINKIRPQALLASADKNRPGMKAADICYTTGTGGRGTLHGIKADYLLLMFYNPGCPECDRVKEHILHSEVINPLLVSGRLKMLAIYPDEDVSTWREYLPQMPKGWTVGHSPMKHGETTAYDIPAIPALYLLEHDKTVLFKDSPIADIETWLRENINI